MNNYSRAAVMVEQWVQMLGPGIGLHLGVGLISWTCIASTPPRMETAGSAPATADLCSAHGCDLIVSACMFRGMGLVQFVVFIFSKQFSIFIVGFSGFLLFVIFYCFLFSVAFIVTYLLFYFYFLFSFSLFLNIY
jgi:hypothetical protein